MPFKNSQKYRISLPLNAEMVSNIDMCIEDLYRQLGNSILAISLNGNTFDAGDILYVNASDQIAGLGIGTSGTILQSNGTLPAWSGYALPLTVVQGDLFYATSGSVVSTLAKNASATRYLSNTGTSNNPAWAQIDLTTGVTGTLPVTNGGTGTATAFTTGSVVFAGASGVYTQDNASLFWDDTNNVLGIGINASFLASKLHVSGANSAIDLSVLQASSANTVLSADFGHLRLHNPDTTNNNYSTLHFTSLQANGTNLYGVRVQGVFTDHTTGAASADLVISTRNAGSLGERLRLTGPGILDLQNQIKIRGGVPGAGKVLTSDANGLATWETATGTVDEAFVMAVAGM